MHEARDPGKRRSPERPAHGPFLTARVRRHGALRPVFAVLLCLILCGPASAAQFAFAVFGDMPYNAAEESDLANIIEEMNREDFAFALHVGDFKSSRSECSDRLFALRRQSFAASKHAFVFIPGDNDWTDCDRSATAPRDPLESLARLRELFFCA